MTADIYFMFNQTEFSAYWEVLNIQKTPIMPTIGLSKYSNRSIFSKKLPKRLVESEIIHIQNIYFFNQTD